jgi:heterodisulfide reductase subunit B
MSGRRREFSPDSSVRSTPKRSQGSLPDREFDSPQGWEDYRATICALCEDEPEVQQLLTALDREGGACMSTTVKEYTYYPGCSVRSTAKHYEESLLRVFEELGLKLHELEDWNCCGATLCSSVSRLTSYALSARNLSRAEREGRDLVAPCSACYLALNKAKDYLAHDEDVRQKVGRALAAVGLKYGGGVRVRHPLEVIINDVGLEEIKRRVKRPLVGFKVASYYGCQTTRPYKEFDDPFYPESLDRLLEALGAEVVEWSLKTRCCGGSVTGLVEEVGLRLNYILINEAHKKGANVIATTCPLCQFNLDCYQSKIIKRYDLSFSVPVVFFTQLLGLALGIDEKELGFARVMVPVEPLLKSMVAATGGGARVHA